jgi:toxin ParE1/3/4
LILALHPYAQREHAERIRYLACQRPGLADRYLDAFWDTALRTIAAPQSGKPVSRRFRSLRLRRFSLRLVYASEGDRVSIVAIAHDRQRPHYWRNRSP